MEVQPSKGQRKMIECTAARGSKLPNKGQVTVTHVTDDGVEVPFTFQNIDVAIPILSIRRVAARDARITFWKGGGEIRFASGTLIPIVERLGVYFVKMKVKGLEPKPDQGFPRPAP